jgi:hypothetical protein
MTSPDSRYDYHLATAESKEKGEEEVRRGEEKKRPNVQGQVRDIFGLNSERHGMQ